MNLLKPEKLKIGDTIAIIALSGNVEEQQNVLNAQKYFENKGYKTVLSENAFDENMYLAGDDEKKVQELHKFFEDDSINAILCMRGGYGALRLINKIDYDLINKNPKIFAGYSDVSLLSAMLLKHSNLLTYWAPMAQGDFGVEDVSEFTEKSFFEAVSGDNQLIYKPDNEKVYYGGSAQGITFGGNLATITSLCGIDFIPDEKFIFFVEELNEPVYKIDKKFTQLFNIQKFKKNLAGIVLGDFLNVDNEIWLYKFFQKLAENIKKPIISGFKITHDKDKLTVPYGEVAQILDGTFVIGK